MSDFASKYGQVIGREPMTTPDPDSAVDAIAKVMLDTGATCDMGVCQHFARTAVDYLREHPEHGPWPVMTVSEARVFIQEHNNAVGSGEDGASSLAGTLVTPDPDPPAAAVPVRERAVREVALLIQDGMDHGAFPATMAEAILDALESDPSLVEAANGGGAK